MEETPIERPHLVRRDPTVATPPTLLRLLAPPVPLLEACRQRPLPPSRILSSDGGEAASVWYGRCRVRLESGLLLLHFPLLHSSRYSPPITNTKPSTLHLHFTHT
ncbi:hypothetical protein BRADI_1g72286v3 [Brachypodium distachyon]|uniref:Uncharacterized protein n=1 Tax=Brachypodium distachyon TaxID=15368 RepID=A0A2K2DUS7_BRADI|nr:hypothetical protein BRADI_1g72286v3 [Brachypodium distachyon]